VVFDGLGFALLRSRSSTIRSGTTISSQSCRLSLGDVMAQFLHSRKSWMQYWQKLIWLARTVITRRNRHSCLRQGIPRDICQNLRR